MAEWDLDIEQYGYRAERFNPCRRPATEKQREYFDAIVEFVAVNGYPPTVRELGKIFRCTTNAVHHQLTALERKGWIERDKLQSRNIRIRGVA